MRSRVFALGVFAALSSPALAAERAPTLHMLRIDGDIAHHNSVDLFRWDGEGFIGGDTNRFWIKSEGETANGETDAAEIQALWSRAVAPFWDVQAGLRVDLEPDATTYVAVGVQGLAPYMFETEATLFMREDGDASARLHQSIDILFTQRLILEPHIELNAYAADDDQRGIGAGIADLEAGMQLRYEVSRQFAPYLELTFDRALGETAGRLRRSGEGTEETLLRAGLRLWF